MKLRVTDLDIRTGGPLIALMHQEDAHFLDLFPMDRVRITNGKHETIAMIDIAESSKLIQPGRIGLFEELIEILHARDDQRVAIHLEAKPRSIQYIKKKLNGNRLSYYELNAIVKDIVDNKLSDIEQTYFISSCYTHGLTTAETLNLTRAIVHNGDRFTTSVHPVLDKHSIGGVAGNRTTMVVVPIVASTGLCMPKTSSRCITSPAGTADTMEVLAPVEFSIPAMKKIVQKVNACIIWGGAVNLAPADDKLIKVEHPLEIDAKGNLLASIMAKKQSVSSSHVLIDIPIGKGAKVATREGAEHLKADFIAIGERLGMVVRVIITDGSQPIGNGLGPSLEARDVLYILTNNERAPEDLKKKAIMMAGILLEMGAKAKKGEGHKLAKEILESGMAWQKMKEIIKAQGGNCFDPEKIPLGRYTKQVRATREGKVKHIDNRTFAKIARLAGAPLDKEAGVYLQKKKGDAVKKGSVLFTIYAASKPKLAYAYQACRAFDGLSY